MAIHSVNFGLVDIFHRVFIAWFGTQFKGQDPESLSDDLVSHCLVPSSQSQPPSALHDCPVRFTVRATCVTFLE